MRNKKLIPFETIEKAVAGEPEAIDAVLRHYAGRIKYLSTYHGHINDDIQDRLRSQSSMECYAIEGISRLI